MLPDILNQPKSVSLLQPTKFTLAFSRLPNVQYFLQTAPLPGFRYPETQQPTMFGLNRNIPGNKIEYDPLDITFLVEETLESWMEIWRWAVGASDQDTMQEYADLKRQNKTTINSIAPQYSDAILTVNSTQNNPILRVQFHDCFPTSLSMIEFKTTQSAEDTMIATASFRFFRYDIQILRPS